MEFSYKTVGRLKADQKRFMERQSHASAVSPFGLPVGATGNETFSIGCNVTEIALLGGAASLAPDKMLSLSEAFIQAISVASGQAKLSQPPVSAALDARSGTTSAPAHTTVCRNLAILVSVNGHHDIRRLYDGRRRHALLETKLFDSLVGN